MTALQRVIAAALVFACAVQQAAAGPVAGESGAIPATPARPVQPSLDCDCASSEADKRLSEQEADLTRRVQLQIDSGTAMAAPPVEFACNDNAGPLFMAYYDELDPPAAVITYGDDKAIVFRQMAASGARYGRSGIEFWEHHGSARVNFYGIKLECSPVP